MNNTAVNVLIWIGIVFAAGFVGYFGRHLAMMLIDRMRRSKPESPPSAEVPPPAPPSASDVVAAARAKVDKKRAKAEVKKAKKEKG